MNLPIQQTVAWISAALLFGAAIIASADDALSPELPPAKGEQCVEPADIMRRDHFEFILHKRDETVYRGIRSSKYSLVECINCHVLPGDNNDYVSHESPEHFCSSCHSFAAVSIDCFECHSDKPVETGMVRTQETKNASIRMDGTDVLSLTLIKSSVKNLNTRK